MSTEAITFLKEDVLAMGQLVNSSVDEMTRLLRNEKQASLPLIEKQETMINQAYQDIEEKCLDLLLEKQALDAKEIRTLIGSTVIVAKFERIADHANRVGRIALWAQEDDIDIPQELKDMANVVHRMVQEVLLSFVMDDASKAQEIIQQDSQVNYLHDVLSKRLLSALGDQDRARAQMGTQFLFCARFIERMGDACGSIAKRVFFIATGNRIPHKTAGLSTKV